MIGRQEFNNGAHCYKSVTVQYNGQKVQATVTDEVRLPLGYRS